MKADWLDAHFIVLMSNHSSFIELYSHADVGAFSSFRYGQGTLHTMVVCEWPKVCTMECGQNEQHGHFTVLRWDIARDNVREMSWLATVLDKEMHWPHPSSNSSQSQIQPPDQEQEKEIRRPPIWDNVFVTQHCCRTSWQIQLMCEWSLVYSPCRASSRFFIGECYIQLEREWTHWEMRWLTCT